MAHPRKIESWVDRFRNSAQIGFLTTRDWDELGSILCAGAFEQGRAEAETAYLRAEVDRWRDYAGFDLQYHRAGP